MRHLKKGRKLGTDASHTKAMKRSLAQALLANDRIKTTETRAKEVRPLVDKVITLAKKGDVHARRVAIAALGSKEVVAKVFTAVEAGTFVGREGGYTRIMKLGPRKGDNAPMVLIELVTESVAGAAPAVAPEPAKKAAPKKEAKEEKAAKEPKAEKEEKAAEKEEAAAEGEEKE